VNFQSTKTLNNPFLRLSIIHIVVIFIDSSMPSVLLEVYINFPFFPFGSRVPLLNINHFQSTSRSNQTRTQAQHQTKTQKQSKSKVKMPEHRFCKNCQMYRQTPLCYGCTAAKGEDVYTVESPKKAVEELQIPDWAEGIAEGARVSITPSAASSSSGQKSPIEPPHPKGQCHKKGQCKERCRYPLSLKG
jgi:hypothetical protein